MRCLNHNSTRSCMSTVVHLNEMHLGGATSVDRTMILFIDSSDDCWVISSSSARAPMYDVWKPICCRKMQRAPTGRLFGLLLRRKKKGICVECGVAVRWRWGRKYSIDSGIVAILIAASLQNMSIAQGPLWIPDVKYDEQR